MTQNFKLPFNLSLLELVSLLGFVSLGYSLLYKMSFYYSLGIPWFINNFTPQSLFFSSIKLIFISLPTITLGAYGGIFFKKNNKFLGLVIIFTVFSFFYYCFLSNKIIPVQFMPYCILFIYGFVMFGEFFTPESKIDHISKNRIKLYSKIHQILFIHLSFMRKIMLHMNKFIIVLSFFACFILTPLFSGAIESRRIIESKDILLNEVVLNNDKNNWYIIDVSSDKFLIVNKSNNFKIISNSDIKEFKKQKKVNFL
ncbi:hypothetical protein [Acinetobacter lactucae]|uniref:hypothetical protein n=1 Tax=Acinetobacter lactucae TaxID=1785128 RepID=UPI0039F7040D